MLNCPLCDAGIEVDEGELVEGDSLICDECGANITVAGIDPLELEAEEDEDEEDDDYDSDDEDEEEEEEEETW